MIDLDQVWDMLRQIDDPEMPISLVDLGIIAGVRATSAAGAAPGDCRIHVDVLPTFLGCPALPIIRDEIRRQIGRLVGPDNVDVQFLFEPPWTADRISPAGRERLRRFGVTTPHGGSSAAPVRVQLGLPAAAQTVDPAETAAALESPPCPFCGSVRTRLESAFGPTRCKMIYYCHACRNTFEHLKRLQP